jgi:hypothetical protein
MPRRRSPDGAPAAAQRRGGTTLTPTSGSPPSGGEEGPEPQTRNPCPTQLSRRHTHQLQPPWHYRRKPCVATTGRIRRPACGHAGENLDLRRRSASSQVDMRTPCAGILTRPRPRARRAPNPTRPHSTLFTDEVEGGWPHIRRAIGRTCPPAAAGTCRVNGFPVRA